MVNDMNVHTDDADTDTDANTYNSKVESAKKNNANRDNDEDDDSKIKSSSSSSEIAKTEDNDIDIDIDIDIIYQETFTPWFAPLLFLAAPFFYKYGIIIYKNKNHDKNANTHTGKDTDDGGTNMETEMEQEQEQSRITFGYGMKGPAITAGSTGSAAGGLSSLSLSPSYWTSHTVSLENIDQDSITVGTASALDNLTTFGGWGIRFGRVTNTNTNDSIIMSSSKASYTFTRAYNACNGPYCEFTELISIQEGSSRSGSGSGSAGASTSTSTGASTDASGSDDMDDQAAPLLKGRRYRIVSSDAEKVASLLRSGSRV